VLTRAIAIYRREGVGSLVRRAGRAAAIHTVELARRPFSRDTSADPYHLNFKFFVDAVNRAEHPGRILELGARNVTGAVYKPLFTRWREYVGFDIHPGENVDCVGDVHRLSRYVPTDHFDFVFSVSVFEHLAMPWQAVLEINKVLRTGGLLFIATHSAWPPHELPWDFWRYFENTFKVLLNPLTGFEIVRCSEGLPCAIVPRVTEPATVGLWTSPANLVVSVVARKIGAPDPRLSWDVPLEEILRTTYPASSR
jgi:SAM-dependent methyltransferase